RHGRIRPATRAGILSQRLEARGAGTGVKPSRRAIVEIRASTAPRSQRPRRRKWMYESARATAATAAPASQIEPSGSVPPQAAGGPGRRHAPDPRLRDGEAEGQGARPEAAVAGLDVGERRPAGGDQGRGGEEREARGAEGDPAGEEAREQRDRAEDGPLRSR